VNNFCTLFNLKCNIDEIDFTPINTKFRKYIKPLFRFSNLFYRKAVLNKYYLFNFDELYYPMQSFFEKLNKYNFFGPYETSEQILTKKNYRFIVEYYKDSNRMLIEKHNLKKIKQYNYPL